MFATRNMAPGQSVASTIGLRNTTTGTGLLSLEFTNVKGALAGELRYSVGPAGDLASSRPESLRTLETGVVLTDDLAGGATTHYRVTVSLPGSAGNEWQDRTATFDLVWTLSQVGLAAGSSTGSPVGASPLSPPKIASVSVGATSSPTSGGPSGLAALAFTGGDLSLPLRVGVSSVAAGGFLIFALRHRRASRRP